MSRLDLTRGQENVFERPIHLPVDVIDWNVSTLEFKVMPHGDHEHELIHKSSQSPPGGVQLVDTQHAQVVLAADDTLELPPPDYLFDWSLELHLGTDNRFVLDYGVLEAT